MLPPDEKRDGCYYRRAPYEEREALRLFAMAAVTLGAVLRQRESYMDRAYVENGRRIREVFWFFEPVTRDNVYTLPDLWKWWNDPEWIKTNPDHPLASLWFFADNLRRSEEFVTLVPPKIMMSRGKNHLVFQKNLPADQKEKAIAALEQK